ncbi:coiled-coil domain-containing protein [Wolbachia endosymbiont of Pentidionis agamae]|uniref:hypothetical protein n=1 Tax=Wolbachia endosymbiont of Pentidionis agamae TaxID=3110435 RepID=UPI002FD1DEBB
MWKNYKRILKTEQEQLKELEEVSKENEQRLHNQIKEVKRDLDHQKAELANKNDLEIKIGKLKEELNDALQKNKILEDEVKKLDSWAVKLRSKLDKKKDEIKAAEKQLAALKNTNKEYISKLRYLFEAISYLKTQEKLSDGVIKQLMLFSAFLQDQLRQEHENKQLSIEQIDSILSDSKEKQQQQIISNHNEKAEPENYSANETNSSIDDQSTTGNITRNNSSASLSSTNSTDTKTSKNSTAKQFKHLFKNILNINLKGNISKIDEELIKKFPELKGSENICYSVVSNIICDIKEENILLKEETLLHKIHDNLYEVGKEKMQSGKAGKVVKEKYYSVNALLTNPKSTCSEKDLYNQLEKFIAVYLKELKIKDDKNKQAKELCKSIIEDFNDKKSDKKEEHASLLRETMIKTLSNHWWSKESTELFAKKILNLLEKDKIVSVDNNNGEYRLNPKVFEESMKPGTSVGNVSITSTTSHSRQGGKFANSLNRSTTAYNK